MAIVANHPKSRVPVPDKREINGTDSEPRGLLKAVFDSIAALITEPSLDKASLAALEKVGEALDVDRCVILENVEHPAGPPDLIPRYQWNRAGVAPLAADMVAKLQNNPAIISWQAPLHEGKPVITTVANANPAVMEMLRSLGLEAMLLVPITVGGKYWGQIGLDDSKPGREWRIAEIDTLLALATLVGTAITRARENRALAEAHEIIRRSPTMYYRVAAQPGLPLTYISGNVDQLGYTPEQLLENGEFYHSLVHPDDSQRVQANQEKALKSGPAPSGFELRMRRADGTYRWFELHRTPLTGPDGKLIAFEGELRDIEERKQVEERLALSNVLLTAATENSPEGILVIDPKQFILAFNQRFVELWNIPSELMNSRAGVSLLQFISGRVKDPAAFLVRAAEIRSHPAKITCDELELADGRLFERQSGALNGADRTKPPLGVIFFFRDITARRRIEEGRERANRALRMMNVCDNIIIHATDEEHLLTDICQAMVDIGGYKLAWIGYARDDAERSVQPVAFAGDDRAYVDQVCATWANNERGRGPTGTAIRTGHIAIVRDTATDPNFGPWREAAAKKGHGLSAALPLKVDNRMYGALTVYGGAPNMFDLEEAELLTDLAADIGFAIEALRSRAARTKAEEDLIYSNIVLTSTAENSPDGILVVDEHAKIVSSNRRFAQIFAIPAALIDARVDEPVLQHVASRVKDVDAFLSRVHYLYDHPNEIGHDEVGLVDGRIIDRHSSPLRHANGEYIGRIWFFRDVTERKENERKLRDSEQRFRTIFESVNDVIMLHDLESFSIVDANERAYELFGYSVEELRQGGLAQLFSDRSETAFNEARRFRKLAAAGQPQTFEWQTRTKDGRLMWVEVTLRKATFANRDFLLSTARDVTARKAAEQQVNQLARTDALTALPNRRVFVEALDQAIGRVRRGGNGFAVLYLDLDHFKDVNDTLGHLLGDDLLKAVGERLLNNVRTTDVVARFGGDEFAVLETDIQHPDEVAALATKLIEVIAHPFKIDGNQVQTGTSIGITINEPGVTDGETLLSHADLALYRAKSEGRGTYRFFTESMNTDVHARVRLTSELQQAIAENQFFLEYQPQVQIATGRIIGVEALVRWHHPQRGVVAPDEFIDVAEHSGLIVPIGRLVLADACHQMKAWVDAGIAPPTIAVNLSANQLKSPLDLEQAITSILAETGLSPHALEVELTETALMEKTGPQAGVLSRLLAMGIRLAIDDFGTGYSSLEYLRRLAVDRIKIAQIFIKNIDKEPNDAKIVRAAISLARELNVEVIAEGVETEQQLELIKSWRCEQVQGFYYARPSSANAVAALLRVGTIGPSGQTKVLRQENRLRAQT